MLNGLDLPDKLPAGCREILSALECDLVDEEDVLPHWVNSLVDPENPGEIRDEVKKIVEQVMVD